MEDQSKQRDVVPPSYPEVPPRFATQGHDFTLQAVIEMQRSIGELTAKTDRLISDVKSQSEKIETVRMRLAWLAGAAAVVGFILALVLAALRYFPILAV